MRGTTWMLAATALLISQSCASVPGPIQISPDTYIITREDHRGIFGSLASLKAEVINEANAFSAKQGKVAVPISSHEELTCPRFSYHPIC